MSRDRLVVDDTDRDMERVRIVWYIAEYGDVGGTLGDPKFTQRELDKATGEDREAPVACFAARTTPGVKRDGNGYYWPGRKAAVGALKIIKLAVKNDGGAPMPDWAKQAIAAGWTAPKGWKP